MKTGRINELKGFSDNVDAKQNKCAETVKNNEKVGKAHKNQDENFKGKKEKADTGVKVFLYCSLVILTAFSMFFVSIFCAPSMKDSYVFNHFFSGSKNKSTNNVQNDENFVPSIDLVDKKEAEGVMSASDIYKKVAPSIVGIVTYDPRRGLMSMSAGQGSGIVMSKDGYVVTNAHVIGNSTKFNVTVVIAEKEYPAKVVGFDTRTDLAVLKIEANNLAAAEFGNSDEIDVGEWVLALGNPGGLEFSNSLTRGIVSAKDRELGGSNNVVKYIQTDAPINPGNSGGALLNMKGQVVGINTAKVSEFEGMGFAIPSKTVKAITDDVLKIGYVSGRVRLGVSVRPISVLEAQANDAPQGLLISEIAKDSNVATSGIKVGDIIVKIDGVATPTTAKLFSELSKHKPGDIITLTVYRMSFSYYTRSSQASGEYFDAKVALIEDKGQAQADERSSRR